MIRPYITRRNLIVIAIAALYACLFVFVGLCLTANEDTVIAETNVFLGLAKAMGMQQVALSGANGVISLVLTAIYIVVITVGLIYVRRFQVLNNISWKSWKLWLAYVGVVLVSVLVSIGLTLIFTLDNIGSFGYMMTLTGESLVITTLAALAIGTVVLAICMLYVNFKKVNKPYEFFKNDRFDDLGEKYEEDTEGNVITSFDDGDELAAEGQGVGGAGVGAGIGGEGGQASLTEGGARELDDREKVFPGLSKLDIAYDGYSIESIPSDDINLEQLVTRFRNYLAKEEELYYDIDTLRIFISGLNATRLSILEGLSGTGKSSLPRYFAKFCGANVTFLPVQVTWRDMTSILGYFNDFSKIYNETDFLLKLYEASYNPDAIQLFVLDEMNISRVEYYFADFLSVLEYPSDQWKIRILQLPYGFVPPAKLEDGYVTIPENSFFVGTANKDDSTFSIADKVYDRATVIAFDNRNEPFEVKGESAPIKLSYSKLRSLFESAVKDESNKMSQNDYDKLYKITDYIYEQFEVAFGNRVMNQIEALVPVFVASGGKKENALDFILARKVLIKLEGRFEEFVKPALKNILDLIDNTYGAKEFPLSRKQLNSLIRKL